jgi:hypothetical protein
MLAQAALPPAKDAACPECNRPWNDLGRNIGKQRFDTECSDRPIPRRHGLPGKIRLIRQPHGEARKVFKPHDSADLNKERCFAMPLIY